MGEPPIYYDTLFIIIYCFKKVDVINYTISNKKIPKEFNDFKIVQLSDFHSQGYRDTTEKLIDKVKNIVKYQKYIEYYESIGQTRDSAIASMKESLESQIKLEFIFGYIADKEKVEMDEDDYSQFEQYVLSSNSSTFTDANAMYEYYGNGDAKQGEDYLKSQYLCNKAIDYVVKNAKVTFDDGEAAED